MSPNSIEAFIELARRDAAVQEQVAEALNHTDPVHALMAVARSAGFSFTAAELTASLGGPMGDAALECRGRGIVFGSGVVRRVPPLRPSWPD